jgi:hypothetical protein
MSEFEREELKSRVEGMTLEEKKQTVALMPSDLLFQEFMIRDKANRETLKRVKDLVV